MVGTHAGGMVISQSRRSRKWTLRHKLLKSCSCQAIAALTTSIFRKAGSDFPRYVIAHSPECVMNSHLSQSGPHNRGNSAITVADHAAFFLVTFFLVSPNQEHSKAIIDHPTGNGK